MLVEVWRSNFSDAGSIPAISTKKSTPRRVLFLLAHVLHLTRTYVLLYNTSHKHAFISGAKYPRRWPFRTLTLRPYPTIRPQNFQTKDRCRFREKKNGIKRHQTASLGFSHFDEYSIKKRCQNAKSVLNYRTCVLMPLRNNIIYSIGNKRTKPSFAADMFQFLREIYGKV